MTADKKLGLIHESIGTIETNITWIRESLDRIEQRAAEDRAGALDHVENDRLQFEALHARMNRLLGGLSLASLLAAGLGFPWLLGLLG